ncbi:MAG: amino acid racemase [Alphaproteobacteria bacterium]|nr:amino acid racemase [Alphaproteobacteria bacterium]MCB9975594.1 amino acid racemase [Rhodospirillales bacterium]
MKIIGLLGGTSWPSTPLYYTLLNRMVSEKAGGHHSARIMLYSIDYHEIKSRYMQEGGWEEIPDLLEKELKILDHSGPDCILICNNTLHKAYDLLADRGIRLGGRVIHLVVETAREALARDYKRVLLLGTQFTMEDGFFTDRLRFFGLEADVPGEEDRQDIQHMQTEISAGRMLPEFRSRFAEMLSRYKGYDCLILGCTELPLAISAEETDIPILNPIEAQCAEAIKHAFSSGPHRGEVD